MAANSLRERILRAVLDAVRAPLLALGATVHRSPTVAITREQSRPSSKSSISPCCVAMSAKKARV